MRSNLNLRPHTLTSLQTCLRNVNPYIPSFKAAIELQTVNTDVQLNIDAKRRPTGEQRASSTFQQAAKWLSSCPVDMPNKLDIIVHSRQGSLKQISTTHRSYYPLHYILLFPFGTDGYHLDLFTSAQQRITPSDFYRHMLQVR